MGTVKGKKEKELDKNIGEELGGGCPVVSQAPLTLQLCLWPPILDLAGASRVSKFGTMVFFSNIHNKSSVVCMSLELATAQLICGILSHSLLPQSTQPASPSALSPGEHILTLLHPLLLSVLPGLLEFPAPLSIWN